MRLLKWALSLLFIFQFAIAQEETFQSYQSQLSALSSKIKAKEDIIRKLIEEKKKAKKPDQVAELVSNLAAEHKELRLMAEEYEKVQNIVRYRFPQKSESTEKMMKPPKVKSLEEMESQVGLDSELDRLKKKMHSQYGGGEKNDTEAPATQTAEAKKEERKPKASNKPKSDEKKKDEGTIVIVK